MEVITRVPQQIPEVIANLLSIVASISDDRKCYATIILSANFFSLSSLFTDFIDDVLVTDILWWRFFCCFVISNIYNQLAGHPGLALTSIYDKHLLLSAMFGTITASCTVFALRQLPIGEATLLLTTAPVFTVILSSLFLQEQLQVSDYLSLGVATLGVLFVAQPDFLFGSEVAKEPRQVVFYLAIAAALLRGFFKAAKFVAVSVTKATTPTHVIVMYLSGMGLLTLFFINSYLAMAALGTPQQRAVIIIPSHMNFVYILAMSSCYFMQQLCVCAAMRYGKPAKASLLKYFDIVLPFLFQITIFEQYPNTWSKMGCFLIIMAMLTVIVAKRSVPKKLSLSSSELVEISDSSTRYTRVSTEEYSSSDLA